MKLPEHVYHLAEATNWPGIQRGGLLCASILMGRAGLRGRAREALDRRQRVSQVVLPSGVALRDQRPIPPQALARCLVGMRPPAWYSLVNAHVFFWLDPDRLNRQRRACGARPQIVLTIDTAELVKIHAERIALTPINTGNARRQPARRGVATFVPYETWLHSAWASEAAALGTTLRARSHEPVELAVRGSVADVMRFMAAIQPLAPGETFRP